MSSFYVIGERILNQKKRLEIIRQKHLREQKRKRILIHRIVFASGIAIVLLLLILLISRCASSGTEENNVVTQATPIPTVEPVISPTEISQYYYADSAFVGNSFIDGMIIYDLIDGADYFTKIGLNVSDAATKSMDNSNVPIIDELKTDKKYKKIFMMFGENELGWIDPDIFVVKYGKLIEKAKLYQPDSKIYLLSVTPISKKVSDENIDNTNNESIVKYNELIKQLAEDKGVIYADIHSAIKEPDGTLADSAASDGIHFGKDYYEKCLLYIQNNIK